MTKRGNKVKYKTIFVLLGIVVVLFFVFLMTKPNIDGNVINGYTYIETDRYRNSYWTCPDGASQTEPTCKLYSQLLSQAATFCSAHCKYLSDNIKQCNPDFHRGPLCAEVISSPTPRQTISPSYNPSTSPSSSPSSTVSESPTSAPTYVATAAYSYCIDSDAYMNYPDFLLIPGLCKDAQGFHKDITLTNGFVKEYSCSNSSRVCVDMNYKCSDAGLEVGYYDGTCVKKSSPSVTNVTYYENQTGNTTGPTPQDNLTGSAGEVYNPNSDYTARDYYSLRDGRVAKCSSDECELDKTCFPVGWRLANHYCTYDGLKDLLPEGSDCENDFECNTNMCISNKCMSDNFFGKITSWFRRIFKQ